MKDRLRVRIFVWYVCLIFLVLTGKEASAELAVKITYDPETQQITVTSGIEKVDIATRTTDRKISFTWNLEGEGSLTGNADSPARTYIPPENLSRENGQMDVSITVTVSDDAGRKASDTITFTLLKPPEKPTDGMVELIQQLADVLYVSPGQQVRFQEDVLFLSDTNVVTEFDTSYGHVEVQQNVSGKRQIRDIVYTAPQAQGSDTVKIRAVMNQAVDGKTGDVIVEKDIHIKVLENSNDPRIFAGDEPLIVTPVAEERDDSMLAVPAGRYEITRYLQRYMSYLGLGSVTIHASFSIQAREVTVGEFRDYVETLDETERQQLGRHWEMGADGIPYPDDRPVENVTWQQAMAYAAWLSQKSGQDLRLPSVQQWAAACVKYSSQERPVLQTADPQPVAAVNEEGVSHLLGNLREWSSDACANRPGFRLLGENYMTDPADPSAIGQIHCVRETGQWPGVGFRLVRIEQQ